MHNAELWKQAENGEIEQWSIFKDQCGNEIIWTGRSFQAYTDEAEPDVYVGMCLGDKWEFVGVEEEDYGSGEGNE